MERFWDARAREDALYFVDTRVGYGSGDEEAFWAGGEAVLVKLLDGMGAEVGRGDHVVDIGCGVGRLTRPLAARAGRVTGIDISEEMLERARSLNAHLVKHVVGEGTEFCAVRLRRRAA